MIVFGSFFREILQANDPRGLRGVFPLAQPTAAEACRPLGEEPTAARRAPGLSDSSLR